MITPTTFKYRLQERARKRKAAWTLQKLVEECDRVGYQLIHSGFTYEQACERVYQQLGGGK